MADPDRLARIRALRLKAKTSSASEEEDASVDPPSKIIGEMTDEKVLDALPYASRANEKRFREKVRGIEDPKIRRDVREAGEFPQERLGAVRNEARLAEIRARRRGDVELADKIGERNVEKYAAGGGTMEVTTQQDGDRTTVIVADQGPGIPRGQEEKIFEPFHRLSNKVSDGVAGTGIGLSIARDLARKHGGDLKVVASNAGARFELEIQTPRARSSA